MNEYIQRSGSPIQLRVIHTVGSLNRNAGGPSRTVTALCTELGRLGAQVELITKDTSGPYEGARVLAPAELVTTTCAPSLRLPLMGYSVHGFRRAVEERFEHCRPQLIHDNGLWTLSNHVVAAFARKQAIPRIVTPRGMLEPWALGHKAWKKRLAWRFYQRRDLQAAAVLHATADQEAQSFRRIGMKQPIAVIPNGVYPPPIDDCRSRQAGDRTALFLSRIHPIKGLLNLIAAWKDARPAGWTVIVAGPDEGNHRAVVETAVRQAGLDGIFRFVGPVEGDAKMALYRRADLFLLPSFSENFGVVVAEALACEVPVITTKGTPWQDLEREGCGWWGDLGVEPLASAIRQATSLSDGEREAMGKRGRAYVEREFGWPRIAQQMWAVYRWMLGQGECPDCIQN